MPTGAMIGGGLSLLGSLGGSFISSSAAKTASQQQADALRQAAQIQQQSLDFQKQIYNTNQGYLSPFINNGTNAMYSLASLYGLPTPNNPGGGAGAVNDAFKAFTQLPAYQFPFEQGNLALERQLNAQGRTQSGAQARETQQFGQGLASTYLMSNYVNPLMAISGQGASAAGSLANAGNATGANIASGSNALAGTYGNIGTAQAAGTIGAGNAWAGGLQGGLNNLAMYSALAYGGGGGGSGTYSLSGPQYGGGNILTDSYGGNSRNPLPGLNASDYGTGF